MSREREVTLPRQRTIRKRSLSVYGDAVFCCLIKYCHIFADTYKNRLQGIIPLLRLS